MIDLSIIIDLWLKWTYFHIDWQIDRIQVLVVAAGLIEDRSDILMDRWRQKNKAAEVERMVVETCVDPF